MAGRIRALLDVQRSPSLSEGWAPDPLVRLDYLPSSPWSVPPSRRWPSVGAPSCRPRQPNLDPETVDLAAWRAVDLAADLAAFLVAITLPLGRVYPKRPKRSSQHCAHQRRADFTGGRSLPLILGRRWARSECDRVGRVGYRPRVFLGSARPGGYVGACADGVGQADPGGDYTRARNRLKLSARPGIRLLCCPGPWPCLVRKKSAKRP